MLQGSKMLRMLKKQQPWKCWVQSKKGSKTNWQNLKTVQFLPWSYELKGKAAAQISWRNDLRDKVWRAESKRARPRKDCALCPVPSPTMSSFSRKAIITSLCHASKLFIGPHTSEFWTVGTAAWHVTFSQQLYKVSAIVWFCRKVICGGGHYLGLPGLTAPHHPSQGSRKTQQPGIAQAETLEDTLRLPVSEFIK